MAHASTQDNPSPTLKKNISKMHKHDPFILIIHVQWFRIFLKKVPRANVGFHNFSIL